jgi:hypothetical protein
MIRRRRLKACEPDDLRVLACIPVAPCFASLADIAADVYGNSRSNGVALVRLSLARLAEAVPLVYTDLCGPREVAIVPSDMPGVRAFLQERAIC